MGSFNELKNLQFDEYDIHVSSEIMRQMATGHEFNWQSSRTNCVFHILG